MKNTFTAILADDHAMVRSGILSALEEIARLQSYHIEILAEVENGIDAIGAVRKHRPDLLLLDVSMPHAGGTEVLIETRRWSPDTRVIIFTGIGASGKIAELVEVGVDGLFFKGDDTAEFREQVPRILQGGRYICQHFVKLLETSAEQEALTERERQILNLVIAGRSNREIGEILGISIKTVDRHRTSLMGKTGVHSAAELIAYALREGLIDPNQGL